MEHTIRQLQLNRRFLTALRTGLTRVVGWHLMEVFAIALCYPTAPVKEHAPRRIRDRLREVSVLQHVARFEFLGNNSIKRFVVKEFIDSFRDKIKTLAGNNIVLLCQSVFCLIPPLTPIRLARQVAMKFDEFMLRLAIKARILFGFTGRGRQKFVRPNIHTTSRLWNTFQRVRHFTNDKAIPTACRLFQRDLFRVSDERTVLADLDFTEFRHFQSVVPCACFTDRGLTDTFKCTCRFILNFVFAQTPRQRADRTLELRVTFLFCFRVFASAKEVINGRLNALDSRYLHILWVFAIIRVFAQFLQMVDLVITRYRNRTVIIHLRTHLEHVVLQLLLMAELRKKPTFLCFRRLRTELECHFHDFSRITPLTPYQWVGNRHVTKR